MSTVVKFEVEWVWVPADVERGHWLATDNTGVAVFPASDGINDLHVYVPVAGAGSKEMVLHLAPEMEDEAFAYAARVRLSRPN